MGTELFKSSLSRPNNCSSKETVEKNIGSEPKYPAPVTNYLKSLLNEIKDKKDIKLSDEADIKALRVRLNAIRFWISNYILIEDRILAFIAFGNTISVHNFLKTLFQFGIYLPRRKLQQLLIDKFANLKKAYLEDPQFAPNVFSVLTDNWNYGLEQDYKPKHIIHEDEVILTGERLMPRKFSVLHFEKQTDAIAKQIVKIIPKRSKFALEPTKTEMKKAKQLFITCAPTLRQDIGFLITEAFKNPARYFPMYKDEVISIGFNWNFNQRNIKGKDCPCDIVITNDKPPPGANYVKLSCKNVFWYVFKGIKSSDIQEFLDKSLFFSKTLSIPKHWKVIKQEEFILLLTPDLKVNRCIAKIKNILKWRPSQHVIRVSISSSSSNDIRTDI